ncbi:MAG: protease modulator HflC [Verrucomicrobia bacterium]|nr:protease modulator HflC [Verrucomicrobiota bacterium]
MNKWPVTLGFLAALLLLVLVAFDGVYTVDMTEQVIVTQGGLPVGEPVVSAGLHFKLPVVHQVMRLEKRVLEWDGPSREMPTKDKTNIIVDAYGRWRISDPLAFVENVRDIRSALSRLDDVLGSEIPKTVGSHEAAEIIRSEVDRKAQITDVLSSNLGETSQLRAIRYGRAKIEEEIRTRAVEKLKAKPWGIELLDVQLKRVNYQPEVETTIYSRMVSERARIAERFRSEGDGEADRILGEKDRELKDIESTAYKEVETIKGKADADAARIYAEAYSSAPDAAEFYEFLQTMEVYRSLNGQDTTLVLSTDSDVFQFLKSMEPASRKKAGTPALDPNGELPLFLRDK